MALTNWAGNLTYSARVVHRPTSYDELRAIVAGADRVRALGSRHSFSTVGDTAAELVSMAGLPSDVEVDGVRGQVRVGGGVTYGELTPVLHEAGFGLAAMASLPHISVAGAVMTGTHGSGDGTGSLATAVAAVEMVTPDGETVVLSRGDEGFDGAVVALGALGPVSHLVLDVEPTYEVAQRVHDDVPWDAVLADLDAVTSAAYSVSLFTGWTGDTVSQVWLKARAGHEPAADEFLGVPAATQTRHMLAGADPAAITAQLGEPGPWHERLPHFRNTHTPSRGEEIQSEYFVPRTRAVEAVEAMRAIGPRLSHVLQVSEVRTIRGDDLWLSPSGPQDAIGLHFTWLRDVDEVRAVLPLMEEALDALGARPHWGKVFTTPLADLRDRYPRLGDFRTLRERLDPDHVFTNRYVDELLGD